MDPVYLDYNATTPIAPEVIEAMVPALRDAWGNPSSAHAYGIRARRALERARAQVAALLGCDPPEVVFTSGGTESDNAAIVGVAEALEDRGRHLIITSIEHPAVDAACSYLERRGWEVTRVGVGPSGRVDPAGVDAALRPETTLVSIMHSNNETGVIQPVAEIARSVRSHQAILHTDAAQSVGKVPLAVSDIGVDLLTVAGHKLYAPKGVGALYVRRGTPCAPLLRGAGHERGLRSGTENIPAIVGLGAACELAAAEIGERPAHLAALRERLARALRTTIGDLVIHGESVERLPNTLSVAIPGIEAGALLERLEGVATAAGAACHSGRSEPSHVLRAMGVPDELAVSTLRLTVGRPTTEGEVDAAALRIAATVRALRT